jgi:uncharacterized protein (TIGR00730 family)
MKRVLVYCGANPGASSLYLEAAAAFGRAVAARGWGIVYGGHHAGLMGAVAESVRAGGGDVTGILPSVLEGKEVPPPGIELVRVPSMHARKALMVERSDAIVALPGGVGTLDELFEQITWRAIGQHQKPVGVFDVALAGGGTYWSPLFTFLDHAVAQGLVRQSARDIAVVDVDADRLLQRLGVR